MLFHAYQVRFPDGARQMVLIRDHEGDREEALAMAKRLWAKRQAKRVRE